VAGDERQEHTAVSAIDQDQGEQATTYGLDLSSVDFSLLGVGVKVTANPPFSIELGEDTSFARPPGNGEPCLR
jgi:hypothetical protein